MTSILIKYRKKGCTRWDSNPVPISLRACTLPTAPKRREIYANLNSKQIRATFCSGLTHIQGSNPAQGRPGHHFLHKPCITQDSNLTMCHCCHMNSALQSQLESCSNIQACITRDSNPRSIEKGRVRLCWSGYQQLPIHGRDPTTAERGDFCLLRFRPGPVRPSLDNLGSLASAGPTILTPGLVRTPDRHRATTSSCPNLKPSNQLQPPSRGITGARHSSQLKKPCLTQVYERGEKSKLNTNQHILKGAYKRSHASQNKSHQMKQALMISSVSFYQHERQLFLLR